MSYDTETRKESLYRKPDTVSITKAQVEIVTTDVIANIPYFLKYPAHLKKKTKNWRTVNYPPTNIGDIAVFHYITICLRS
jgi:hypothetical protein